MDLVVIFGPPAVGKMAVGRELARLTGLRLFHNHMALEPVLQLFPFGSEPFTRLVGAFRSHVFREVAASDLPGLIYTFMWLLDEPEHRRYIDDVCALFRERGARIHFVELYATLDERLRRNRTGMRLREKPSKRAVAASERRLLENEAKHRMNSRGDFFYPDAHVRIDNTDRPAEAVAKELVATLRLPVSFTPNPARARGIS
jgi:hypothetical protein